MPRLYLGLALVAAATLAYEIALTRLFAIAHGYHFAFLAVSLALLGFGASGTALALRPTWSTRVRRGSLAALALLAAGGLVGSYVLANRIPFDPYRVAWEPRQVAFLAAYLATLAAPFLIVGLVQGLPLVAWPERAGRLYGANLVGSGLGSLASLGALNIAAAPTAVVLCALLAALGGLCLARRPALPAAVAGALAILAWQSPAWLDPRLSPYKPLSQLRNDPASRVLARDSNALAQMDVIESRLVRSAPGLSLGYTGALPRETAIVLDAENVLALPARDSVSPAFVDALPTALPFRLRKRPRVLVLEPGGGLDVLAALAGGARAIVAVEQNPLVAARVRYRDSRVRIVVSSARTHLARSSERFDIVDLALSQGFRPVTAGAFSLTETYLLTREAFNAYLAHLRPGGLFVVHRWLQLPPVEELRAAALLLETLDHLIALRSFSTMLLVGKREPFSVGEIALVKRFARERQFDLVYYPGIRREESNRFNVLRRDRYFEAFQRLAADPRRLYESYDFDVRPPTDDRPFFSHFFKVEQTRTVLALLGKTWQPFGGSGYLVLVGLLVVTVGLSLALLAVPVAAVLARRRRGGADPEGWGRPAVYFAALGFGFLLVEIPLIQRSILLLDHASYAFAIVLFGLLASSGVGSALSERVPWRPALIALVAVIALYALLLEGVFAALLGESFAVRALAVLLLLAPLGLLMGVPFPRGIRALGETSPSWLPLAWGVNGFASVVSGILAALIALSWGFAVVLACGATAYLTAAVSARPAGAARRARP